MRWPRFKHSCCGSAWPLPLAWPGERTGEKGRDISKGAYRTFCCRGCNALLGQQREDAHLPAKCGKTHVAASLHHEQTNTIIYGVFSPRAADSSVSRRGTASKPFQQESSAVVAVLEFCLSQRPWLVTLPSPCTLSAMQIGAVGVVITL